MTELVGRTLQDRYRVDVFLGRGGMADVYKVWDQQRLVYLAMKALREDLAQDRTFLQRFQREARVLESLQHPNIVRYYGLERDGLLAGMLMHYIDGTTLRAIIFERGQPLPPGQILSIMRLVLAALNYSHASGVYHCDMKPGNVLIDRNRQVYVTDFGIARLAESATVTFSTPGTPAYMSPEQCRGVEEVDARTDVYAVGVMLYEMVTGGERPFRGDTDRTTGSSGERIRWQHLNEVPVPPGEHNRELGPGLEQVILRCLAKRPAERYQTASELLEALERAIPEPPEPIGLPAGVMGEPSSVPTAARATRPRAATPTRPRADGALSRRVVWPWMVVAIVGVVVLAGALAVFGARANSAQMTPTVIVLQQTETMAALAAGLTTAPTNAPSVTSTMTIAVTPPGTFTAIPRVTGRPSPTPTPMPTSDVVSNALVSFRDDFSDADLLDWSQSTTTGVFNGNLMIDGHGTWAGISRNSNLREGQALLVRFSSTSQADYEMFVKSGGLDQPDFIRWGIFGRPAGVFSVDAISLGAHWQTDGPILVPGHWYELLLRIGGNHEFVARIWDEKNPAGYMEIRRQMDASRASKSWNVGINVYAGTLDLDRYEELFINDVLAEDRFDDPRFDGDYNHGLWTCSACSPASMSQLDGVFRIAATAAPQAVGSALASQSQWGVSQLGHVQSDLELGDASGTGHADVHLQIWADLTGYQWWTSCDFASEGNAPNQGSFYCHVNQYYDANHSTGEYNTQSISVAYGTWHNARIEIDPANFRLSFYFDNTLVGSDIPNDAEQLKRALLRPEVGTWTNGNNSFTAYVDNFTIGGRF